MFLDSGMLLASLLLIIIGSIWLVVYQFRTAWYWGIFGLLLPITHIFYLVIHTKQAIGGFLTLLVGIGLSLFTLDKLVNQAIAEERFNWVEFYDQQQFFWFEDQADATTELFDYVGLEGYCEQAVINTFIEPDSQQYSNWSPYSFNKQGFAIHLPEPAKPLTPIKNNNSRELLSLVLLMADESAYGIRVATLNDAKDFYSNFKETLLDIENNLISSRPNHLVLEKKRICLSGAPGIEIKFQPPKQTQREKIIIYLVNNTIYQISAQVQINQYDAMLSVIDSFKLLEIPTDNSIAKQTAKSSSQKSKQENVIATTQPNPNPQTPTNTSNNSPIEQLNTDLTQAIGKQLAIQETSGKIVEGKLVKIRSGSLIVEQKKNFKGQRGAGSIQYIVRFRNISSIEIRN